MRSALVGLLLTGCLIRPDTGDDYPPPDNTGWGSGSGGSGGNSSYGCQADTECGTGGVCARDGTCTTSTSVRIVHVMWTLKGQPASTTTCRYAPDLAITFLDEPSDTMFGFAPVPCSAGKFTVDKLPTHYGAVDLTRAGEYSGGAHGTFDANGNVTLDLPY